MTAMKGLPCPEAIHSLLAKMETLSGMIHELCSISEGDNAPSIVIKNAMNYCTIRTGLFANIFMPPDPLISKFNVDEAIIEMVNLMSRSASYQFQNISKENCFIQSDRRLFKQALFVLLKHIEAFFRGEEGILDVATGNADSASENTMYGGSFIELHCRRTDEQIASGDKKRILIVDDEEAHSGAMKKSLIKHDFDVHRVPSGFVGLDFICDHNVDLIILDIAMDGMRGTEMLKTLRKNHKHRNIPVLICSGKLLEEQVDDFLKEYARFNPLSVYLKPLIPSTFIPVCKDFIETQFEDNSIQNLLTNDIEEAILNDSLLRMGYYPVVQICDLLGFKISIKGARTTRTIRIETDHRPLEQSATNLAAPLISIESPVDQEALNLFYSNYKHDCKNKLLHIMWIQTLIDDPFVPITKDAGHHIFAAIDECEAAIDAICSSPKPL